jgi:hypothetical protein
MVTIEALNPVAQRLAEFRRAAGAPRPSSLDGKRIGLLWNSKRGGDVALETIGTALQDRFPGTALVKVWGVMSNPEPTFTKVEQECDVVVGATGD